MILMISFCPGGGGGWGGGSKYSLLLIGTRWTIFQRIYNSKQSHYLLSVGMNVWVRYLFVKEIFLKKKVQDVIKWQRVNIAGIILGFLSALGISMVANFQVISTCLTIVGNWLYFNQTFLYFLFIIIF